MRFDPDLFRSGALVLVLAVLGAPVVAQDPPPTNILVLLADDLGVDNVGTYGLGGNLPATPRLDALAAEGVTFVNAWSNPYCSPTRATLLTGRYSFRTGIGVVLTPESRSLSFDEVTLPEMLDLGTDGAWDHAAFGKWHVSNASIDPETNLLGDPQSGGLDHPLLSGWNTYRGGFYNLQCGLPVCNGAWFQGPLLYDYFEWPKVDGGVETLTTTYATTDTVDDTLAWIGGASEPWLCYVPFHAPHAPFQAPPSELHSQALVPGTTVAPGESPRPYYKAMVEALDTEIGRLLDSMDPEVRARTMVIFLGDNGSPGVITVQPFVPSHAKGTVYDGGINVPMIVTGPMVQAPGRVSHGLVNTTDLLATVAKVADVDLAEVLPAGTVHDSVDFLPYLVSPQLEGSLREYLFAEHFAPAEIDPVCQKDFGVAGPGDVRLTSCGDHLYEDGVTDFEVTGMPPGASASCCWAWSSTPPRCWAARSGPTRCSS